MSGRQEFRLENGNVFYIRRYDPFLAMKVLGDVQKKFLAPFAQFMEANDRKLPQDVRDRNMTEAIDKISKNLDGDSLIELTRKVLNQEYISVVIDGKPPEKLTENVLNMAVDSVGDVFSLVFEVLRVNFEDLFMRGKNLIGTAQLQQAESH